MRYCNGEMAFIYLFKKNLMILDTIKYHVKKEDIIKYFMR